jgi:putative SOS response-associated peptidase YedK
VCGRYGFTNSDKEKVKKTFRLKKIDFDLVPRYNIAPGQDVSVILNEMPEELTLARWGLVPFWSKDEKSGYKMINARSETIFEKPSFRGPIKKKRCLIPADLFYEWKKVDTGKQPFCIRLKSKELFAFAGIWDCWEKGENALVTCSIITCPANKTFSALHDRMPVILQPNYFQEWLAATEQKAIQSMLAPLEDKFIEAYRISDRVNSPGNEGEDVIRPVA